jgi:hypothetical protein
VSESFQKRREFIALVEDMFRELGFSPPATTHDPDQPLAMELEVAQINFEIVHIPHAAPERFLVECHFGEIPIDKRTQVLTRLLEVNLALARSYEAVFGVDLAKGIVIYTFVERLGEITAPALLASLHRIANKAREWRLSYYLDDDKDATAPVAERAEILA